MFTHIRTSLENKARVTELTRRLGLGAENVIARLAIAHSLSKDAKLSIAEISNSKGKEYTKTVLFGDKYDQYLSILCVKYSLHRDDIMVSKLFKLHLDSGLERLDTIFATQNGQSEVIQLSEIF